MNPQAIFMYGTGFWHSTWSFPLFGKGSGPRGQLCTSYHDIWPLLTQHWSCTVSFPSFLRRVTSKQTCTDQLGFALPETTCRIVFDILACKWVCATALTKVLKYRRARRIPHWKYNCGMWVTGFQNVIRNITNHELSFLIRRPYPQDIGYLEQGQAIYLGS